LDLLCLGSLGLRLCSALCWVLQKVLQVRVFLREGAWVAVLVKLMRSMPWMLRMAMRRRLQVAWR
jgi:hypothetical protein